MVIMDPRKVPPGVDVEELLRGESDLLEQLEAIHQIKVFIGLVPNEKPEAQPTRPRRRIKGKRVRTHGTWLDDIVAILRESGSPMHWSDMYVAIQQRRPGVSAKEPAATIGSYVRRAREKGDMRVVRVGDGKFALSEWQEKEGDDTS
jgi:hypothetical protein